MVKSVISKGYLDIALTIKIDSKGITETIIMTNKPKKGWQEELRLFDEAQAKSDRDYYNHTSHIGSLKVLDKIRSRKARQKVSINYD